MKPQNGQLNGATIFGTFWWFNVNRGKQAHNETINAFDAIRFSSSFALAENNETLNIPTESYVEQIVGN